MTDPNSQPSALKQEKPEKKSLYMVFVEGEGFPTVKQPDFKSAHAAARKLADKFPDRKILVLHHCKTYQQRDQTSKGSGDKE